MSYKVTIETERGVASIARTERGWVLTDIDGGEAIVTGGDAVLLANAFSDLVRVLLSMKMKGKPS